MWLDGIDDFCQAVGRAISVQLSGRTRAGVTTAFAHQIAADLAPASRSGKGEGRLSDTASPRSSRL